MQCCATDFGTGSVSTSMLVEEANGWLPHAIILFAVPQIC